MTAITALLTSSVGQKIVVAATGVALLGFLVVHMLGNLLVYQGADALNGYAAFLKASPFLWPARLGLLAVFAAHIALAVTLARKNRAARPQRYARPLAADASTLTSRSMLLTGAMVLAFVIYHLLHFTLGVVQPATAHQLDASGRHDVYAMVLAGFRQPVIALSYIVAMLLLGTHLLHGASSLFQTLGLDRRAPALRLGARAVVAVITLGNLSMPLLIWLGVVGAQTPGVTR